MEGKDSHCPDEQHEPRLLFTETDLCLLSVVFPGPGLKDFGSYEERK